MTDRRPPTSDQFLVAWFEDGPTTMPDRVLDVVTDRIGRQRQRRSWRLLGRLLMNTYAKVAVAAAAILVAAVAGYSLLPHTGPGPAGQPTPSPTLQPSPVALTHPAASLAAGTYSVSILPGEVTFTLPAGWSAPQVGPDSSDFTLHLNAGPADDAVLVMFNMRRAAKDAACTEGPEPGSGSSARTLADDLAADANLRVTPTSPIRVGTATALVIDVTLAPAATRTCPFSGGAVSVPLIVDTLAGTGPFWGIGPNEKIRLVLLDRPGSTNAVVVIDSAAGASFDQLVAATMPVVESFAFSGR